MNQRFSITPANAATDLRLTDSVHRTLTVIGIFGDKNGWCWPSQSTLAEMRGVSRQTINTHTKELIKLGYLNIQPRYDEETGAQKSNMMQIKFDFAPDLTGGSKSKTLQGGTSPEIDTPPQAQGFTHNALSNDPIERPSLKGDTATPSTPPKSKTKKQKAKSKIPESINTQAFREMWEQWRLFKGNSIKEMTYNRQLARIERESNVHGLDKLIALYNLTMDNGWKGPPWDRLTQAKSANGRSSQIPKHADAPEIVLSENGTW